ncbi:hypothetical protein GE061_003390 [Apolygus lucorum]|uniref:C2H2-type domain-containing protein n=1 Tax=Apolygus lucorum TaxID=248454 RepID=A0A8S9X3E6_APOLU|nr:hypothetical protein GE061_003390 [Apolygus lucorum]
MLNSEVSCQFSNAIAALKPTNTARILDVIEDMSVGSSQNSTVRFALTGANRSLVSKSILLEVIRPDTSGKFGCNICSKIYLSKGALMRHLRYECGKQPTHQCPHCSYRAKYRQHMQQHIITRHLKPNSLSTIFDTL